MIEITYFLLHKNDKNVIIRRNHISKHNHNTLLFFKEKSIIILFRL